MGMNSLMMENVVGTQASTAFGGQLVFGARAAGSYPGEGGSAGGVPDNSTVADSSQNPASSAQDYGKSAATQPAHKQAIYWAVISVFIGLLLLAHFAHVHNIAGIRTESGEVST